MTVKIIDNFTHKDALLSHVIDIIMRSHNSDDVAAAGIEEFEDALIPLPLDIAETLANASSPPVAVFSMGMDGVNFVARVVATIAKTDPRRFWNGKMNITDFDNYTLAIARLHNAQFYIDATEDLSTADIRSRVQRLSAACGGVGLILLDRSKQGNMIPMADEASIADVLAEELSIPTILVRCTG